MSLDPIKATNPDMLPGDNSTESVVEVDSDVITTVPIITNDDILEQVQKDHSPGSDKEDGSDDSNLNDEAPERALRAVESALDVLKNISIISKTREEM